MWNKIPSSKRKELQGDARDDGEFWMSFTDFQKHFTDFELCSVSVDQLYEDDNGMWEFKVQFSWGIMHINIMVILSLSPPSSLPPSLSLSPPSVKNWNAAIKSGSWLAKDGSAGGCRNYPTFVKNPQFIVDLLEDDDGDGKCSCLIALMQKHRRKQKKMGVQDLCIGFSIYKVCI